MALALPILMLLPLAAMSAVSGAKTSSSEIALAALESRIACLQTLKDAPGECDPRIWAQQGRVSFSPIDVNGDGRPDLIVRQVSLFHCGTEGRSTNIHLRSRNNRLRLAHLIVAHEPIVNCVEAGRKGLRFATKKGRGGLHHLLIDTNGGTEMPGSYQDFFAAVRMRESTNNYQAVSLSCFLSQAAPTPQPFALIR